LLLKTETVATKEGTCTVLPVVPVDNCPRETSYLTVAGQTAAVADPNTDNISRLCKVLP